MWLNLLDYPALLILSLCYQYLHRTWMLQQIVGIAMCVVCLLYVTFFMRESPYVMYSRSDFDELREHIEHIRFMNGILQKINYRLDREEITTWR
jgi:hypothetical protein